MILLYTLDMASGFFGPKHYKADNVTAVRYANELVLYTQHGSDYLNMLVCKEGNPIGSYEIDSSRQVKITKNSILSVDADSCELSNRVFR